MLVKGGKPYPFATSTRSLCGQSRASLNMTTVSPKLTDRMLVLATAGAARLGLTLGQALAMSDPFNPASGAQQTASDDAKQDNSATASTPTPASADDTH